MSRNMIDHPQVYQSWADFVLAGQKYHGDTQKYRGVPLLEFVFAERSVFFLGSSL